MVMDFTEDHLKEIHDYASLAAAHQCGVKNPLDLTVEKRIDAVSKKAPALGKAIRGFFTNHRAWYDFHLKIHDAGKQGKMSADETSKHLDVIGALAKSREAFIGELKKPAA